MKYSFWVIFLIIAVLSSCVPTKRMTYLQNDKLKGNVPKNVPINTFLAKDNTYILKPDDIISIKVSSSTPSELNFFSIGEERSIREPLRSDPLLSGFRIDKEGKIELPVIGRIKIAGLTLEGASNEIRERVLDYLEAPSVNIQLLNFDYTVVGEVSNQGKFRNYDSEITVLEAIGTAGGFTDFADRENVKIVRNSNDTTTISYVNLLKDDLLTSPYYYLKPNDVIAVAPLPAKNWRMNNTANIGLIISGLTALSLLLLRFNN